MFLYLSEKRLLSDRLAGWRKCTEAPRALLRVRTWAQGLRACTVVTAGAAVSRLAIPGAFRPCRVGMLAWWHVSVLVLHLGPLSLFVCFDPSDLLCQFIICHKYMPFSHIYFVVSLHCYCLVCFHSH